MDRKIFKLPLLAAAAGMVLRFFTQLILIFMMDGNAEWTDRMNTNMFIVRTLMSIALIIGIGLLLRKTFDRRTMLKAATLLALIILAVYIMEQTSLYTSGYLTLLHYLYLPGEIFNWVTYLLFMVAGVDNYTRLFVIPHLLAPYLFMMFTIRTKPLNKQNILAKGENHNEI